MYTSRTVHCKGNMVVWCRDGGGVVILYGIGICICIVVYDIGAEMEVELIAELWNRCFRPGSSVGFMLQLKSIVAIVHFMHMKRNIIIKVGQTPINTNHLMQLKK